MKIKNASEIFKKVDIFLIFFPKDFEKEIFAGERGKLQWEKSLSACKNGAGTI